GLGSRLVRRRHVHPDAWRLRLRGGIRYRAQIPRDAPLPDRADLHQPHPFACGDARAGTTEVVLMTDITHLREWIGKRETLEDLAAPAPVHGLAALLDHETPPWTKDTVPPLGHWLYFLPLARQSDIDVDGHGKRGGFLPPVDLPRRMFAGS